ncbi:MAG: phosphoglyceromutase [Microbacteriaceae bacterium]
MTETANLILIRHGQSDWNQKNLFTGWVDVDLTEQGRAEAKRAGELLVEHKLQPRILFTSRLTRAIDTANIALDAAELSWIDVERSWRLNERHYGALQGLNKAEVLEQYGEEQFMTWRRSFDTPPPVLDDNSEFSQAHDPRYDDLDDDTKPRTEALKQVIDRMLPYWEGMILPEILEGEKTVLVVAHGNSLRALVKHLEGISDADITDLNIPTGIPLVYRINDQGQATAKGVYLDPDAAAAGAAAVASQGKH